jgi:hypothetical protein
MPSAADGLGKPFALLYGAPAPLDSA